MQQRVRDWMRDPGLPSSTPPGPDGPDRSVKPGMVSQLAACLHVLAEGRPTAVALLPNSDLPVTERRRASDRELLRVYRQAAQRAGLPVIDAWTAFGADPFGDGRLVNGFPNAVLGRGHLNALGHARLAEVLAQGAAEALLAPGKAPLVAQGRGGAP
jgi:lysophospholipase L1-like esterase